ncbi:DUF6876 family protein [Sporomusa termitida]|uniref:DUF6876 domain-containing protein n=1 Tax=Sporomusa termitida TaxID=2377 RepID=A0A517DQK4_9FIRM|nr:DUF6876 family protein [Sporomusa termitida]QDR79607.1 hypothetical protein SPTER_08850 [Sporomusa termitida]
MKPKEEILDVLNNSVCTENYYKVSPIPGFPVITDGVLVLTEAADCYWLLDVIGSYQNNTKLDKNFQVWTLNVNTENNSAVIRGYNDTTLIVTQQIPCTDFPPEEVKLYLIDGVILLPSEY